MVPRPLTVLQVLPALESGGVERGTLEVARELVRHGHRSLVISAGGRMVAELERDGSEHIQWDIGRKSLWTLRLIPRLRRFLRENQVDILHARSRLPAWVCYLAWKGMAPQTRPRFVTTVHGLYSVNRYSAIMTRGERVIAVSNTVRDYILTNYPLTDPARIKVIHRGVDPAEFPHGYQPSPGWLAQWRAQYPQLQGKYVITLPGRLTRWKGQEDFIRVIAGLKQRGLPVHGLLVGDAHPRKQHYAAELRAKVAEAGLSADITFTGHRSDLKEIMAVSDVVLSLSTDPEAFGRVSLEALSLGVPVAAYNHGGVAEQLAAVFPVGRVPVGDYAAMMQRLAGWHAQAPSVPGQHPFTLAHMLESTLDVYRKLAAAG
ncbi:MAG: glycosyltransferase family 4 protein [Gammaproteobacteria bacterium]|nr:glycosyltransferase family 4 protein [Gammaproteobacteria bacterium]